MQYTLVLANNFI